jgi:hypothetical protein
MRVIPSEVRNLSWVLIEERFLASLGMIRRWVFENETEMGVGEWHRERF